MRQSNTQLSLLIPLQIQMQGKSMCTIIILPG